MHWAYKLLGRPKTEAGHRQTADLQVHDDLGAGVVQDGLEWLAGGGAQVVKACVIVVLDDDWHAGHGGLQGGRAVVVGMDPAGRAGISMSRDCREGRVAARCAKKGLEVLYVAQAATAVLIARCCLLRSCMHFWPAQCAAGWLRGDKMPCPALHMGTLPEPAKHACACRLKGQHPHQSMPRGCSLGTSYCHSVHCPGKTSAKMLSPR